MPESLSLVERHRGAQLMHELCRPSSAAVIAHLPVRPGAWVSADVVREASALSVKEFWTTVSRLESLSVLARTPQGLAVARDHLDEVIGSWVADSPLHSLLRNHPGLTAFIQWGRVVRMPTEPRMVEELYAMLADLFVSGEIVDESDLNARIAAVHDDPADVRRALVDRGLLLRTPGTAVYRRP